MHFPCCVKELYIHLPCMRLTEIILINIWVERMVVGVVEGHHLRANLGNFKIFREFHKAMAAVTMLYIHALLSQS